MAALLAPRPRAKSRGPTGGLNCERESEAAFSAERTPDAETVTEEVGCRVLPVSAPEGDGASLSTLGFAEGCSGSAFLTPSVWEDSTETEVQDENMAEKQ